MYYALYIMHYALFILQYFSCIMYMYIVYEYMMNVPKRNRANWLQIPATFCLKFHAKDSVGK